GATGRWLWNGILGEFHGNCSGGNRLNSLYLPLLQGIWQRTVRSRLDPPPEIKNLTPKRTSQGIVRMPQSERQLGDAYLVGCGLLFRRAASPSEVCSPEMLLAPTTPSASLMVAPVTLDCVAAAGTSLGDPCTAGAGCVGTVAGAGSTRWTSSTDTRVLSATLPASDGFSLSDFNS